MSIDEVEEELWLCLRLRGIRFHRLMLVPATFLIQLPIGTVYAWSGYNAPIEKYIYDADTDMNIAPITFYIALATLGVTAAIAGPWIERNGLRTAISLGATLFFAGHLITALGVFIKSIIVVYIGYGLVGGMGLGVSYLVPVSALQKWFPERRGAAGALAVAGFGSGAIAASYYQRALMSMVSVPLCFIITGACYFTVMTVFGIALRLPPPDYSVDGISAQTIRGAHEHEHPDFGYTVSEALRTTEFILMYITFMGNQLAGVLIISKIQTMATTQFGRSTDEAAFANAVLGVFNLLGRLLLSFASDHLGRKTTCLAMLVAQAVAVALLPTLMGAGQYPLFLSTVWLIAFMYGGGFGVVPAFLADQFSSRHIGATFGVMLTAWTMATVLGAGVFVVVFNESVRRLGAGSAHVYDSNFYWMVVVIAIVSVVCALIPTRIRDRLLPRQDGELVRVRLPSGRLLRLHRDRPLVRLLSDDEQEREWRAHLRSKGIDADVSPSVVVALSQHGSATAHLDHDSASTP